MVAHRCNLRPTRFHTWQQELVERVDLVSFDDDVNHVFHERAIDRENFHARHRRVVKRPRATFSVWTILRAVYLLDVEYAVGRLAFDTPDQYRRYAEGVATYETTATVKHAGVQAAIARTAP